MGISIDLPADLGDRLYCHMSKGSSEQLAFLLCHWESETARVFDLRLVPGQGFDMQTPWHLSLSDDERASMIRWAHDGRGCLIEAHSHRLPDPAEFSASDLIGLEAFVPHVWWRLSHRPYAALVFCKATFDGLAWRSGPGSPEPVERMTVEGCAPSLSTQRSYRRLVGWR